MFIRSERLFLRPGWAEDRDELRATIADEGIVRNLSRAPWPYTEQDAAAFLDISEVHRLPHFLITLPGGQGARIIGAAGLHAADGDDACEAAELGYWIARSEWGRGYATEAARAMLGLARALGHEQIVARHFVDNPASGRVLEKVGFRRTGRVKESFSLGRGKAAPARFYELCLEEPGNCDSSRGSDRRRAA